MDSTTSIKGRSDGNLLSREEVIAEFRKMAAQAREKGQRTFETGWARAADLLERQPAIEDVEGSADELEPDPNQLTFGFDLELGDEL